MNGRNLCPHLLLCLLFLLCNCSSAGPSNNSASLYYPKYTGWVNDFENILTTEQEQLLNERIKQHEKETSNEIVIEPV